jgi:uncharacterized protein YqfA (UPF0365 family)
VKRRHLAVADEQEARVRQQEAEQRALEVETREVITEVRWWSGELRRSVQERRAI